MYQLPSQSEAIQAARLLAVIQQAPVLVMERDGLVWSIGAEGCQVILSAGFHVATVFPSGHVEQECKRTNWLQRWLRNVCRCEVGKGEV